MSGINPTNYIKNQSFFSSPQKAAIAVLGVAASTYVALEVFKTIHYNFQAMNYRNFDKHVEKLKSRLTKSQLNPSDEPALNEHLSETPTPQKSRLTPIANSLFYSKASEAHQSMKERLDEVQEFYEKNEQPLLEAVLKLKKATVQVSGENKTVYELLELFFEKESAEQIVNNKLVAEQSKNAYDVICAFYTAFNNYKIPEGDEISNESLLDSLLIQYPVVEEKEREFISNLLALFEGVHSDLKTFAGLIDEQKAAKQNSLIAEQQGLASEKYSRHESISKFSEFQALSFPGQLKKLVFTDFSTEAGLLAKLPKLFLLKFISETSEEYTDEQYCALFYEPNLEGVKACMTLPDFDANHTSTMMSALENLSFDQLIARNYNSVNELSDDQVKYLDQLVDEVLRCSSSNLTENTVQDFVRKNTGLFDQINAYLTTPSAVFEQPLLLSAVTLVKHFSDRLTEDSYKQNLIKRFKQQIDGFDTTVYAWRQFPVFAEALAAYANDPNDIRARQLLETQVDKLAALANVMGISLPPKKEPVHTPITYGSKNPPNSAHKYNQHILETGATHPETFDQFKDSLSAGSLKDDYFELEPHAVYDCLVEYKLPSSSNEGNNDTLDTNSRIDLGGDDDESLDNEDESLDNEDESNNGFTDVPGVVPPGLPPAVPPVDLQKV